MSSITMSRPCERRRSETKCVIRATRTALCAACNAHPKCTTPGAQYAACNMQQQRTTRNTQHALSQQLRCGHKHLHLRTCNMHCAASNVQDANRKHATCNTHTHTPSQQHGLSEERRYSYLTTCSNLCTTCNTKMQRARTPYVTSNIHAWCAA